MTRRYPLPRFAVVPTRNRPDVLMDCVRSVERQVDKVIVINNGDAPITGLGHHHVEYRDPTQPVNLSKLWNRGLDLAAGQARFAHGKNTVPSQDRWDVAVLNDDTVVPEGWFDTVSEAMRHWKAAAGCSGPVVAPVLHTRAAPVNLYTRMQGWAFILAGELGVRANEDLHWWAGDDDVDWKSRLCGGTVMVPGFTVQHRFPNGSFTPELHVQAAQDMATFVEFWERRPW